MGKKPGRPKKVRDENDDGKPHRLWDITDWQLYDKETGDIIPERLEFWKAMAEEDSCRKLMLAGEESPDTHRWHGQARIAFISPHRFDYVRKIFTSHCEATVACDDWSYFKKFDSKPLINVDYRKQGKRNVFAEQMEAIKGGATIADIADLPGANWQSLRSAEKVLEYFEPERPPAPRHLHPVDCAESPMPTGVYRLNDWRFWNRYDGHSDIYVNQRLLKLSYPQLRMLVSPAPFIVGRGRQARFDHVYISGLDSDERKYLNLPPRFR